MFAPETPWRDRRWAIVDVESTGTDAFFDRVIEIGVLVVEPDGSRARAFSSLINPGCPIPATASAINGITDDAVSSAPTFAEIVPALIEAVGDALPIAYSAKFDRAFIAAEFLRAEDDLPAWLRGDLRWIDPLTWARAAEPYAKGAGRFKLDAVATRLGVDKGTAHRALGDCETTARVMRVLAGPPQKHFREQPPREYGPTIQRQTLLDAIGKADFLQWLSKQPPRPSQVA